MTPSIRAVTIAFIAALGMSGCFDSDERARAAANQAVQAGGTASPTTTGVGGVVAPTAATSPPQLSGTPASDIPAGFPYVFKPAIDPSSGPVTFQVVAKPAWATFDVTTGELRGVPALGDVGITSGITIVATNARGSASIGPFAVRVTRGATSGGTAGVGTRPPTISGTPPTTAVAGSGYSFQVQASDPDGDRLTYGAINLPAWLGINTANGTLTGTPSSTQVATYRNIVLSVTDGNTTVSLPAFTITVAAAPTTAGVAGGSGATSGTTGSSGAPATTNGTATLRWTPPTTMTDGSSLGNLAGYRVKSGRTAAELAVVATVTNAAATSYTVQNLTSGTWYFAVAAFTSTGLESDVSAVVSKTFP
jgi:hypothetical protein